MRQVGASPGGRRGGVCRFTPPSPRREFHAQEAAMQLSCQRAERPVVAICSTGFWWGVECARETSLKLGGGGDRCLRLGHLSSLGKETFLTML